MIDQSTDTGEQSFRKLYTINIPPQNADVLFTAIPSVPWGDTSIQDFQPQGAYVAKEGVPKVDPSWSSSSSSIVIVSSSAVPSSSAAPSSSSSSSSSSSYSSSYSSSSSYDSGSGSDSTSSGDLPTANCETFGYFSTPGAIGTSAPPVTVPPGYTNSGDALSCYID